MLNRIKDDYNKYKKNKPLGGIGGPIDDTLKIWEVVIPGPKDSPFEGGKFKVKISFPEDYPNSPPYCKFLTKVFHPNISFNDGSICANFLKKSSNGIPDESHTWTNKRTVCDVIVSLYMLLKNPNQRSPLNSNANHLYNKDPTRYEQLVRNFTNKFAK